jgi:hypothetical protein
MSLYRTVSQEQMFYFSVYKHLLPEIMNETEEFKFFYICLFSIKKSTHNFREQGTYIYANK